MASRDHNMFVGEHKLPSDNPIRTKQYNIGMLNNYYYSVQGVFAQCLAHELHISKLTEADGIL